MASLVDAETRRRTYQFRAKGQPATDGRTTIAGYASVYGERNSFDEVFVPGAFLNSLADKSDSAPLVMGWQHREAIGKWLVPPSRDEDVGLYLEGPISKTRSGEDVSTLVRDGAITGLSVGFNPDLYQFAGPGERVTFKTPYGDRSYQFDSPVMYILQADVLEASLVIAPADEGARITEVRSKAKRALPGLTATATPDDAMFSMALLLGARGTAAFADAAPSERRMMFEQVAAVYQRHNLTPPEFDLDPDYAEVEFHHDEREVYAKRTIARRITDLSDALRLAGRVEDHELLARADEAALELKRFADQANRRSAREALYSGLRATIDSLKEAPSGS